MKKTLLLVCLFIGSVTIGKGQNYEDSLLRSAGFFISPAVSNFLIATDSQPSNAHFGLSLGFRFKNEIAKGFFLEGGVGITAFSAGFKPAYVARFDYYTNQWRMDTTQRNLTQINVSAPFLAGYRTRMGKVRFEGALGFAFNLRLFEFEKNYNSYNTYGHDDGYSSDLRPHFGPSLSAIARAGITLPLDKRTTIDILPTLRYAFVYFSPDDMDILQCMHTDENQWSLGLDVGLTWKLTDPNSYSNYQDVRKAEEAAFTIKYMDTVNETPIPVKTKPSGPKNFIYMELGGNGMVFSTNYERTVYRNELISVQARAGFGMIPESMMIPFGANIAFGKNNKKFEMGIGATAETLTDNHYYDKEFKVNLVPSLAFRLETDAHFFLRLALLNHYFFESGEMLPSLGVSLGGCF